MVYLSGGPTMSRATTRLNYISLKYQVGSRLCIRPFDTWSYIKKCNYLFILFIICYNSQNIHNFRTNFSSCSLGEIFYRRKTCIGIENKNISIFRIFIVLDKMVYRVKISENNCNRSLRRITNKWKNRKFLRYVYQRHCLVS